MIIKHDLIIDKEVVLSLIQHKRDRHTVDKMRDEIVRKFYPQPKEYILYPCWICNGRGKIKDPEYDSDPVEGMKMAPLVACVLCKGKLEVNKTTFLDHVKRSNNSANSRDNEFKDFLNKCISLYSKLTLEEAKFITLSNDHHIADWRFNFDKVVKHDIVKIKATKEALAVAMKEGMLKALITNKKWNS